MPSIHALWPLLPLIIVGSFGLFAWRYFRSGSLVGALLGGRIKDTIGEVSLHSQRIGTCVLRVHTLEPSDGGPLEVALAITTKAVLSASLTSYELSQGEARELASLLQRAGDAPSNNRWRGP